MDKGFVILAQNTKSVNYVKCAEVLAASIKLHMPDAKVSLISDDVDNAKNFDSVISLPYGDLDKTGDWKLINDWQIYEASPYEHTIKLEADLFITKSIDHWFDLLNYKDVVLCTTIRNFKQEISKERFYRRFIDDNKLPDVYNAITCFKKSDTATKFFELIRFVFENWNSIRSTLKCNPDEPVTTDWAYAYAAHILGIENVTIPNYTDLSMIHMKQHINVLPSEDWTDILVYEILSNSLRINTIPQIYPFHYHVKKFSDIIERSL